MKSNILTPGSEAYPAPRLSIAVISACALAYEILLIRLFSIIQWHHFAYMIISLALLGYGISGTFLALNKRRLTRHFPLAFVVNILGFALSALVCFSIVQHLPFNPQELLWDSAHIGYLLLSYLLLALPFLFVANAIGLALMTSNRSISSIYAADLMGAGTGCLGIVIILYWVFPATSLQIISLIALLAAALASRELRVGFRVQWLILACAGFVFLLPGSWLQLKMSPYKELSQILQISGTQVVQELSSPLGLLSVVESSEVPLRHAPGLSMTATTEPPEQVGVFTDGDALTVITQNTHGDIHHTARFAYLDQLTSALPYHLSSPQRVLILGTGGGSEVLQARYHDVPSIDAVEMNPQMVQLVRKDYAHFSGDIYSQPEVHVHIDEARGFVTKTARHYDLIQLSLMDAFNASSAGLYALNESYLYTVEALQKYIQRLTDQGYLAITRWVKLPPRDSLRLFATAILAVEKTGISDASRHLLLIRSWQTSTLLLKRTPFTSTEIASLKQFCVQRAFDVVYYPGIKPSEVNRFNQLRQPIFYQATQALLGEGRTAFLDNYKYNIQPAIDDRPYFFNFFKWNALPEILNLAGRGGLPLLELGYLLLVATLLQAIIVSILLVMIPLLASRFFAKDLPAAGLGYLRTFGYFLALGLAYLFLEIAFIQKFILLLNHPLYSIAVVLATFLIFSGLGSRYSLVFSRSGQYAKGINLATGMIIVLGVIYLFVLEDLFSWLSYWPTAAKVLVSIVLIAPIAFCMGMPFPLGLGLLSQEGGSLIPWAWGVNGCASVISAVLATMLAIHFGFTMVVVFALLLYFFAAVIMWTANRQAAHS